MNMFAQDAPSVYATPPIVPDQLPKPKGGMFGGGGKFGLKEALAFGLAGLVSRHNPALLQGLMGALNQRNQSKSDDEQYQRQRNDHIEDWKAQQQWKIDHPEAINNDTVNDYGFIRQQLGDEEAANFLRNKANPPMLMNIPGVGIVQVPRQGSPQQPQAPVGRLTPIDEGGPALGGPGGFPF